MTQVFYDDFVAGFKNNPKKVLFKFLALNAQGADKPQSIMRLLAHYQLEPNDALFNQLLWLDQYDLTDINGGVNKPKHPYLHLFAQHDVLVTPPKEQKQNYYKLIPSACHALSIHQPDTIKEHCLNAYDQLNLA